MSPNPDSQPHVAGQLVTKPDPDESAALNAADASRTEGGRCPDCQSQPQIDQKTGEHYCPNCGLVIQDVETDSGQSHYSADSDTPGQSVPPPQSETLYDRGLSTTVGWVSPRDGPDPSVDKRKKFHRLRKLNAQAQVSGKQRMLRFALRELQRMGAAADIPESTIETASALFRRIHADEYTIGRCIESLTAAALYIACRQHTHPHSLSDIAAVSRTEYDTIKSHFHGLQGHYQLPVTPDHPERHLPQLADQLETGEQTRRIAHHLLTELMSTPAGSGLKPRPLAATALYTAGLIVTDSTDSHPTQSQIADLCDCNRETILRNYEKLLTTVIDSLPVTSTEIEEIQARTLKHKFGADTIDELDPI
jgi:transcription initiation factor TFIIB